MLQTWCSHEMHFCYLVAVKNFFLICSWGFLSQKVFISKKINDIPTIILNLLKRDKVTWMKKIE